MDNQEAKNKVTSALAEWLPDRMAEWKVPGMGIAVVKDGEVLLAEGFGLRDLEQGLPVTADTMFAIGSSSKAFAAAAVAVMVDEGKLEWDKPVRDYLPNFKLKDDFASARMTPRDLLCHRSGLPRHDLMWYNSTSTREEMFGRLQHLEPSRDFRAVWQYQNLMYMTAGYLAGKVAGSTWEEVVRTRIFEPLSMKTANFSVDDMQSYPDHALPYDEKEDELRRIDFRNINEVGPAGSINATPNEMAQWIKLHLGSGKLGEQQIISEANTRQLHSPQMVISEALWRELFGSDLVSYGLGWFIHTFNGETMLQHGGNIDGFSALVSFIPARNVGVVTLTNRNGTFLTEVATFRIYEALLGLEHFDHNSKLKSLVDKMKDEAKKAKAESSSDRKPDTQPSHPLSDYAGDFEHPGYGVFRITEAEGKLTAAYNRLELKMEHYHYDIFEATLEPVDVSFKLHFHLDVKGNVEKVSVPLEPTVAPIVFTRMADSSMKNKAFLERFVGEYELMGMTVTIALRGEDSLLASVPGQGDVILEPYQGTTFNLKGLPGFSIEFVVEDGSVTAAKIGQPNGTFTATRRADVPA
ncbi:MAG: serine hydrolase [Chloroflexi bacterium]|nr:serine hydrolase [Chloroflexota bacterium]